MLDRITEVLKFYADKSNYESYNQAGILTIEGSNVDWDYGEKARELLDDLMGEPHPEDRGDFSSIDA